MSGTMYVVLGYAIGLGLLWGYGLALVISARAMQRKERSEGGQS
jgi:hypothetical protein